MNCRIIELWMDLCTFAISVDERTSSWRSRFGDRGFETDVRSFTSNLKYIYRGRDLGFAEKLLIQKSSRVSQSVAAIPALWLLVHLYCNEFQIILNLKIIKSVLFGKFDFDCSLVYSYSYLAAVTCSHCWIGRYCIFYFNLSPSWYQI